MQCNELSPVHKTALRKVRASGPLFDLARNTLNKGITSSGISGAYIQFATDCRIYGLYEALLYAEGYERQKAYAAGTVATVLAALVTRLNKRPSTRHEYAQS